MYCLNIANIDSLVSISSEHNIKAIAEAAVRKM